MKTTCLISLVLLFVCRALHAQGGPLTPPGTPAPTMKSLDQIEPRTPISTLPFTISQGGSYYLTRDLNFTAASGHAITITTSNVSLDLGGFTLSSSAAVTGSAIICFGTHARIGVRNGRIIGTTSVMVSGAPPSQTWSTTPGGFDKGVDLANALFSRVSDLDVSACRNSGISLGENGMVERASAFYNGGVGIQVSGGLVSDCVSGRNGNVGVVAASSVVSNVRSSFNATGGILADQGGSLTNCIAISNGGLGIKLANGSMSNCVSNTSGSTGILASISSITNCTTTGNAGLGISANNSAITLSETEFNLSGQTSLSGSTVLGNNP